MIDTIILQQFFYLTQAGLRSTCLVFCKLFLFPIAYQQWIGTVSLYSWVVELWKFFMIKTFLTLNKSVLKNRERSKIKFRKKRKKQYRTNKYAYLLMGGWDREIFHYFRFILTFPFLQVIKYPQMFNKNAFFSPHFAFSPISPIRQNFTTVRYNSRLKKVTFPTSTSY